MVSEPVGQPTAVEPASGEVQDEPLLLIGGGIECLHGGMPHPFVAIDESSASVGYKSLPPNVALGWATADSSAPKSRIPAAPPVA
jgi:hypothetical protein